MSDGQGFYEFVSPIFIDGVGYVGKVAVGTKFASPDCPAVDCEPVGEAGSVLCVKNGARTLVSAANIRFVAWKRAERQDEREQDTVAASDSANSVGDSVAEPVQHDAPPVKRGPGRPRKIR